MKNHSSLYFDFPPSASVLTNRCLNGGAADAARAVLAREAG